LHPKKNAETLFGQNITAGTSSETEKLHPDAGQREMPSDDRRPQEWNGKPVSHFKPFGIV
jgi:hypothetical protein